MSEYPKYFYKYRPIKKLKNLDLDYSLKGLFQNQAVFSNRMNFNDLFDSKIELVEPTAKELEELNGTLAQLINASGDGHFENGEVIPNGNELIESLINELNSLLDSYPFYCVSENPKNNLMWSHYASAHTGFCIEFKSKHLKADRVDYQDTIPKIELMDLVRLKFNPNDHGRLKNIWTSLRIKLNEWEYEEEYRFQASNSMKGGRVPKGDKFIIIPYGSEFVESIIFGCRMEEHIKEYIVENMPKNTKFKQAIEKTSSIEIIESNLSPVS